MDSIFGEYINNQYPFGGLFPINIPAAVRGAGKWLRDRMYQKVEPTGYTYDNARNFVRGRNRRFSDPNTEALFGKYTGQDSVIADYDQAPDGMPVGRKLTPEELEGIGQDEGATLAKYAVNDVVIPSRSRAGAFELAYPNQSGNVPHLPYNASNTPADSYPHSHQLGTFHQAKGQDDRGTYVTYDDIWDINPFRGQSASDDPQWGGFIKMGKDIGLDKVGDIVPFGRPFEIHGKQYYDKNGRPVKKAEGGHLFGDGGEEQQTNNRPQDEPQLEWMRDWLSQRKDILQNNAEKTTWGYSKYEPRKNTGDVRKAGWTVRYYDNWWNPFAYLEGSDPTKNRVNKLIFSQIENARNTPKQEVGSGSSDNYNMRGVYVQPDSWDNSGNYVAFAGQNVDPATKVHEFTHASHPTQQEIYIVDIIFKDRDIPKVAPKARNNMDNAKELYGALQEFRYRNGLSPKQKIDQKYIDEHRAAFKGNYLDILSDSDKLRLFNEVASNSFSQNNNMAAYGGSLQPKDAWDSLSLREKSEMMRVAVRNGITDLKTIREKYNEFAEGGDTKQPVTIGGAGYIPDNFGQGALDMVRRKLYDNVQPWGYNDIPQRVWNAVVLNKPEPYDDNNESRQRAIRDDLWATYLQIPQKDRHVIEGGKVTLEPSPYKPKGAVKEKDTYRFNQLSDAARQGILAYTGQTPGGLTIDGLPYLPLNTNRVVYPNDINAYTELEGLGQFTVGRGRNDKGEYVSYYDSWDLGDTNDSYKDMSLGIGKPFNIYDRIYLDDYYEVPEEHRGGSYLPEVTVFGNKHSDGGSIRIKPENRGKFTALKERTGHSATWFKEHGTPAQRKMATFDLNSRHWKHGLGGNLFGEAGQMQIGRPYYSYDWNGQRLTDENGNPVLNYNVTLPEVTIIPDKMKSPAQRNEDERYRQRYLRDYAEQQSRDYTARQSIAAHREWENSPQKKVLDLGIATAQGIGMASDVTSSLFGGIPVYSGLKGAEALDRATRSGEVMDYVDAGLWLSPMLTVAGKKVYDTAKPALQKIFQKEPPASEWFGVEKPRSFQSELDWSPEGWFGTRANGVYDTEDVTALQFHLPEYLEIEKAAKANGTWLKMPDGSTWKGDPRSWVQLQSKEGQKLSQERLFTGMDMDKARNPNYTGDVWTDKERKVSSFWAGEENTYPGKVIEIAPAKGTRYVVDAKGHVWSDIPREQNGVVLPITEGWEGTTTDGVMEYAISKGYPTSQINNEQCD